MPDFFFIEEYSKILRDSNGSAAQVTGNPIALHKLPIDSTGIPARTAIDFNRETVWVQIHSDRDVYYAVGEEDIVADENDRLLRCGVMRPVYVDYGKFKRMSIVLRLDD